MELPQLRNFNFTKEKVLVRCDFDVPLRKQQSSKAAKQQRWEVGDDSRIRECLPTIQFLFGHGAEQVILMGHLGRPNGKVVKELSLEPVAEKLKDLLNVKCTMYNVQFGNFSAYKISENILLLENLRFDLREEENDLGFAKELASLGDFYVNEAFAVSHREHASVVGVAKFLPHCAGLHFASEVENLSKVLENPKRPFVFVVGGAKAETKLPLIADFARIADTVLVGGLLAKSEELKTKSASWRIKLKTVVIADLLESGLDINGESIKKFVDIIRSAGTIVWNGPMGKYEEPEGQEGTKGIAEAIADSAAFKVVGGGDTIAALKKFGLLDKMDYVSTGGGAMLEFLAKGNLPGIRALL